MEHDIAEVWKTLNKENKNLSEVSVVIVVSMNEKANVFGHKLPEVSLGIVLKETEERHENVPSMSSNPLSIFRRV